MIGVRTGTLVALLTLACVPDPRPEVRPMALERIGPAEFVKRSRNADRVVTARIEEIDAADEYSPGCGILYRVTHKECPAQAYRVKLREDAGRVTWALFQIPWEGFMPLREGLYATFFLHQRYFESCAGAGAFQRCRSDRWLALNAPADVVAP